MLLEDLAEAIGADRLVTDPASLASYGTDWTGGWSSAPIAVARPRNTAEVQAIVRICNQLDLPIHIQGGNTGLVGGSVGGGVPHLLLSTRNLRQSAELDRAGRTLLISAGYTLAEVHALTAGYDFHYGVDVVSREDATIGGNIATNAGGIRVCAFGDTSRNVLEVEAVTADGAARWYPAADWLGSEGVLGVITAAKLRLQPRRTAAWSRLVPSDDLTELIALAESTGEQILAAELFEAHHVAEVAAELQLPGLEARSSWWLLLEGDTEPPTDLPAGSLRLDSPVQLAAAWHYREHQAQLINQRGAGLKLDSAVPRRRLPAFIAVVQEVAATAGVAADDLFIFGHLAVGNLHLGFANLTDHEPVQAAVLQAVLGLGGSVRAEHGVGRAKAKYYLVPEAASGLRQRLDPARRFNRGIAGK